jgi:hypothetical protein
MTVALVLAISMSAGGQVSQVAAVPAPAGQPAPAADVDSRWVPWLGCWRPDVPTIGGDARVCFVPGERGAVRRLTIADGQVVAEEQVVAGGGARPVEDRDCRGTEAARWLGAKPRLVRESALTCGKDAPRTVTGLSFLVRASVWAEAQAVDADGTRRVRLQRFRRAADQQLPGAVAAPRMAGRPAAPAAGADPYAWTIDDVIETSGQVPPEVLQAALSELNAPFPLSAKALVALDEAGVPASVIDLMVALSNPRKFVVHRADGTSPEWSDALAAWPGFEESLFDAIRYAGYMVPGLYDPLYGYWDYWGACAGPWSYWGSCAGHGSYYSGYPGGYWDWGGGGGGWVEVSPPPAAGGGGEPRQHGRVVKGLGYTQVDVRRERSVVQGGSGSGETVSGGSGSSGSGSSASPSGYSSGSSGGGGAERTAQPRGPGGV